MRAWCAKAASMRGSPRPRTWTPIRRPRLEEAAAERRRPGLPGLAARDLHPPDPAHRALDAREPGLRRACAGGRGGRRGAVLAWPHPAVPGDRAPVVAQEHQGADLALV